MKYLLARKVAKVRQRALETGVEFSLRVSDIPFPEACPVLDIPLDYSSLDNTPSLDRIDPTGGYTPSNVRVISHRANTLKNNGSWNELLEVALDSVMLAHGEEKARACAEAIAKVLEL